jgi:hypothetical protein
MIIRVGLLASKSDAPDCTSKVRLVKIRQDIQGERSMTPQEQERLEACITEMAQILYNNTPTEKITTLEEIEKAVRQQMMEHVSPKIASPTSRQEILDWYHLRENLYKIGGSLKRLKQAEAKLWHGQVDEAICASQQRFAIAYFVNSHRKQARNFCAYLAKHRHRKSQL